MIVVSMLEPKLACAKVHVIALVASTIQMKDYDSRKIAASPLKMARQLQFQVLCNHLSFVAKSSKAIGTYLVFNILLSRCCFKRIKPGLTFNIVKALIIVNCFQLLLKFPIVYHDPFVFGFFKLVTLHFADHQKY